MPKEIMSGRFFCIKKKRALFSSLSVNYLKQVLFLSSHFFDVFFSDSFIYTRFQFVSDG